MSSTTVEQDLRYPIGRLALKPVMNAAERQAAIDSIAAAPANLRKAVSGLSDAQLDTPYRPDGWTVRQLVHHVADSHVNAYTRLRLALTEQNPTVKPYAEAEWARLEDARTMPVQVSLDLLDPLHTRWVALMRTMSPDDFQRTMFHPDNGSMTVDALLSMYEWHGKHHVAHVTSLRNRSGW
jgi:DinB superfamily